MKKFNITSKKLATIGFTVIVWICVIIAAAFAVQESGTYIDDIASIGWLVIAGFFEWIKHRVTHQEDHYNDKD